jgi:putative DNA primase/helicase
LRNPARASELATLLEARSLAADLVGADASCKPVCHPIRWPGSWHRKSEPKLARIARLTDNEIDLAEAVEILRGASGAAAAKPCNGSGSLLAAFAADGSSLRAANDVDVRDALSVIPNNDLPWGEWNRVGLACWAATNGSETGFEAFAAWSAKSQKNDPAATLERWKHYFRSPPDKIGFGSLVFLARQSAPGWTYKSANDDSAESAAGPREKKLPNDVVTEDSAALRFVEQHGENLRFCHSSGSWFVWNGARWQVDRTNSTYQLARELGRELGEDQDGRGRKAVGKTSFASGIERFAQVDPRVAVTVDYWDQDLWLLGTPGGTVDLKTGALRDQIRSDGITKSTLCAPLEDGCPRWLQFLEETTGGDADLIRFLQQWCGYALTGITREHALMFIYGPGGNGKSVFINVMTAIMAEYATTSAADTFTASQNDRHSTELAMLHGARLVTASETEDGRAWAEARIKAVTGGDKITARYMRQDNFTFTPQFKLIVVGNHKPVLHNVDDAARRRFNIVPFMLKPEQPDHELERKLLSEAGGILNWMINGCLDWQREGLIRPDSVREATEAYFGDQDLFGQWLEDCCDVKTDRGPCFIWDRSADLFDSWSEYARRAGEEPGAKKTFAQMMQRRGFEPYRQPGVGTRGFRFIRLRPTAVCDT